MAYVKSPGEIASVDAATSTETTKHTGYLFRLVWSRLSRRVAWFVFLTILVAEQA